MNRTLYTILFYFVMPFVFLRLLWRSWQTPAYRQRWRERLGFYSEPHIEKQAPCIVIHAVSVGEVHAAAPLIERIRLDFPSWNIALTTSTPTGSSRVKDIFGVTLQHVYLPYDLPGAIKRFLQFTGPDLLILMETELWPNLIHYSRQKNVAVMLANARLSEKSLQNYQKIPGLSQQMLKGLNLIAVQSSADEERFLRLGVDPSCLVKTGSMKFDFDIDETQGIAGKVLRQKIGARPVLIAGSTRDGEEEKVLAAFQQMLNSIPALLLILVPRHPERFSSVYRLIQERGLSVKRRSDLINEKEVVPESLQVVLGDTMGEMQFYYASADIAFVGGSLVNTGCQNIIEPAALGLPIITGPSLFNFQSISSLMIDAGAMRVVDNFEELALVAVELLNNTELLQHMAQGAIKTVALNKGATSQLVELVEQLVSPIQK